MLKHLSKLVYTGDKIMPNYENYEQLVDIIGWLDQSVIYKFITRLATKDQNGNRNPFHKEYTYRSGYNDMEFVTSIKRSFDSYLVIENIKDKDVYIQIRAQNMIMFQHTLNQMSRYLFDDKLWGIKDKRLIIKGKPEPMYMQNLPMGKWLSFELIIFEYNGQFDKGVRITLSDSSKYVDVRIDTFMGLVYQMGSFDMYMASMAQINYLQRPPFGTNMVTFDDPPKYANNVPGDGDVQGKSGRKVEPPKPQRSFFSKVENISN